MRKLRMGYDPRNLGAKNFMDTAVKVMEKHAPTFKKLAEVEMAEIAQPAPEKTIIVETRTQVLKESRDKWSRKHSKLAKKRMETMVDGLTNVLNQQNEELHKLRQKLSSEILQCKQDIAQVAKEKHKEIQVVTKKHTEIIEKSKVPKLVWLGLAVSLLTNAFILLTK